jgi:hypothetical protein
MKKWQLVSKTTTEVDLRPIDKRKVARHMAIDALLPDRKPEYLNSYTCCGKQWQVVHPDLMHSPCPICHADAWAFECAVFYPEEEQ